MSKDALCRPDQDDAKADLERRRRNCSGQQATDDRAND
jgi:hypothetical protein